MTDVSPDPQTAPFLSNSKHGRRPGLNIHYYRRLFFSLGFGHLNLTVHFWASDHRAPAGCWSRGRDFHRFDYRRRHRCSYALSGLLRSASNHDLWKIVDLHLKKSKKQNRSTIPTNWPHCMIIADRWGLGVISEVDTSIWETFLAFGRGNPL